MNETFTIELYEEDGIQKVLIGTENSTGTVYEIDSLDELDGILVEYLKENGYV